MMTNEQIKELGLLIEGLNLKEQPDGSMDFHPYIYEPVRAALARACQPQWISVDERLPGEDGNYLVAISDEGSRIDNDCFYTDDSSWEFFNDSRLPKITHWMPLPELPNNETKGDRHDS